MRFLNDNIQHISKLTVITRRYLIDDVICRTNITTDINAVIDTLKPYMSHMNLTVLHFHNKLFHIDVLIENKPN